MFDKTKTIAQVDPELHAAIVAEDQRQEDHIELIASENYTSPAVMEAQGCQMKARVPCKASHRVVNYDLLVEAILTTASGNTNGQCIAIH